MILPNEKRRGEQDKRTNQLLEDAYTAIDVVKQTRGK